MKKIPILLSLIMLVVFISNGCDKRNPSGNESGGGGGGGEDTISYYIDGYAFRDLIRRTDLIRINVQRNDIPYASAEVSINNHALAFNDNNVYFGSDWGLLRDGSNRLKVYIQEDNFTRFLDFVIPDSFQVVIIDRPNPGGQIRYVVWSLSPQASGFYLAVNGLHSDQTGVEQYSAFVDSIRSDWYVPAQAFRTPDLILMPDIYYLYVIGYTNGLTPYDGADFFIPDSPGSGFVGIPGTFAAGLIAPVDSFIVSY